jgi:hypothetical protein
VVGKGIKLARGKKVRLDCTLGIVLGAFDGGGEI